jgi:uncharacterized protein (TIGR04255 family)
MPQDGIEIPLKLKHDFILEVVFELRFETSTLPEVLFGRLADHAPWRGFRQEPLPAYSIPAVMRQTDPNLRYQPVLQLVGEDGRRSVRVGPQVASYHRTAPYVGWLQFSKELEEFFHGVFGRSENTTVSRLGIRYINAATKELHGVSAFTDLDIRLTVKEHQIVEQVNVNYLNEHQRDTQSTVRIATPDLVIGTVPSGATLMIDVDVYTKSGFSTTDPNYVSDWAGFAHGEEKKQFFRLLKPSTIEALRER